jgi:hypothetical protein
LPKPPTGESSIQRLIDAGTQTPALLRKQDGDRSMVLQLPPGKELAGRFRIVRFIAAGGMGDVYEVEDLQLGERLAIKTIRPEVVHDARAIARFKREIQYAHRAVRFVAPSKRALTNSPCAGIRLQPQSPGTSSRAGPLDELLQAA